MAGPKTLKKLLKDGIFDPNKLLRDIAPKTKVEQLLKQDFSLKKTVLGFVDSVEFLDKKEVSRVALKTLKSYKKRLKDAEHGTVGEIRDEIQSDPRLLIARVQNEVITQISEEIRTDLDGEQYEWLPSDANEPDPEHQLNYGKIFTVGDGEQPGDRYGCRCGMRFLKKAGL